MNILVEPDLWKAIGLLILSNIFMTTAWYGHLRFKTSPLLVVIGVAWFIALFEYCLQVPANRIGSNVASAAQLKVIQEVITFIIFFLFSWLYLRQQPTLNDVVAFALVAVAVAVSLFRPFGW
jgi:uncharacterized protein (DUF486 family)